MLWLYTTLIYIAAPLVLLQNYWRGRVDPLYRERLGERWGYTQAAFHGRPLWIHAVSVGEVQASAVLIRSLLKRYPAHPVLVTTGTPTGAQRVRSLFGTSVAHAYLPYDMPGAVRRFLNRVRPAMGIVMETEIWPNLFRECRARQIPLLLANARLSETSVRRYRRLRGLTRDALADVVIEAQSEAAAARFREIGANAAQTHVAGNVKFDIEIPSEVRTAGQQFRASQFANRPVWIAASTHEGEEEAALNAHQAICAELTNALLILVPRHPQRFEPVRSLLVERGFSFISRSTRAAVAADTRVLLVDTMGELLMLYAAADLAFVGGSLVPIGGHSLLEPAALQCPILVGPHNFNAIEIARLFIDSNAAVEVGSEAALAAAVVELLKDEAQRRAMTATATQILDRNRGALDRLLARIEQLPLSLDR